MEQWKHTLLDYVKNKSKILSASGNSNCKFAAIGDELELPAELTDAISLLFDVYDKSMTLTQIQAYVIRHKQSTRQATLGDFLKPV